MTDIAAGVGASPGRLKIKIKRIEDKPEPAGRASWEAYARRWLITEKRLGYINASGRDEAMAKARKKWPREKHIRVYPA